MVQVIAEISLFPLADSYDTRILDFLTRLRQYPGLSVEPGSTATIVRGNANIVLDMLRTECVRELGMPVKTAITIKLLNTA